jgi:DNA processing protein
MQTSIEQEQTILWSLLHEPGDALARAVFDRRGVQALEDFRAGKALTRWSEFLDSSHHSQLRDLIERIALRLPHRNEIAAIERAIRWNARPLFEADAPSLFERLSDLHPHNPYLLWVAGDISLLEHQPVAIVGTRNPSDLGIANARRLVRKINRPVISGGAKGIDATAHETALELGLPTAAFMAGGLDRAYPQSNWELFHRIVQSGGAMVSEMACTIAPTRFRFLQRNRLIAAAATSTFVVEAGFRSGSKNTAGHSRSLGRNTFALAGPKDFPPAAGCNHMIESGFADPIYLENSPSIDFDQTKRRVEDAILNGARTVEEIARESGLSLRDVRAYRRTKA